MYNNVNYVDDYIYFENIKTTHINKICNIQSDNVMNDDTFNAIKTLSMLGHNNIDLSGLLLNGILIIDSKLSSIINLNKIDKIDCSNNYFDIIIINIPNNIKEFTFNENPIKKIFFPHSFNKQIDDFHETLETIIFPPHSKFNKSIDNLPNSLKILCLGNNFNQSISNLPNNIEHLILPNGYNNKIIKIPTNLKTLIFNANDISPYYSENTLELDFVSNNLELLILPVNYNINESLKISNNLKIIIFYSSVGNSKNINSIDLFTKKHINNDFKKIDFIKSIYGLVVKEQIYFI